MDFFTAQDNARRRTGLLVVLLILAVLALIIVTTLAFVIALYFLFDLTLNHDVSLIAVLSGGIPLFGPWIAAFVLALVVLGGLYKQLQLSRGGKVVATSLGGREIAPDSKLDDERRILNVVEEMAIAAGMPVPPVYLLDEPGINAFAAGHNTGDAVIGITQGAIKHLSRDELQGVIAHEFSHILHGDMRLNLRLVSVLHGVLVIGLLGNGLMRSMRYGPRIKTSKGKNPGAVIVFLAAALMLIGFAGTFFGNWIKAAVSRQREYLADASAVQFTRHPEGIGNALIRIGLNAEGSRLEAPQASQFSHLYFSQAMRQNFMATHPPLKDRIRRVMPGWNGQFDAARLDRKPQGDTAKVDRASKASFTGNEFTTTGAAALTGVSARAAIASMGQPGPRHLAQAQSTLEALPRRLKNAAQDYQAVRALMYGLLLSQDTQVRKHQLASLEQSAMHGVYPAVMSYAGEVLMLKEQFRLPLVELALPALKNLTTDEAVHFRQCLKQLINADGQVSLFEWTLYHWLVHHLGLARKEQVPATRRLKVLQQECQVLLNVLANAGQDDPVEVSAALKAAARELPFELNAQPIAIGDMQALGQAVSKLRRLLPQHKHTLLQAMARCIEHSGQIKPAEAELFRATADMLDCPVPPLLVEQ
ncbi:Zn-dependent protease with chaperone function [Vreelandella songnenensis]|uniref:Zn-dependent protease with chaperone function n=1 Tax=Vreelandella songnenensis TaxID=1176243 RepID=A0A2T0V6N0_9GAMM|nr:M48 family metallopeptidase [Halomonas songnenensis]PRY65811.1 Zn-dependent protease with chaperone function [Halomonas songnenensis]